MMRTENQNLHAKQTRQTQKKAKGVVSAAVCAERLCITKPMANEIIEKQRELGSSHYGCNTVIYKRYKEVHKWQDVNNFNWHMFNLGKSNCEFSHKNKDSNTNVESPKIKLWNLLST